MLKSRGPVRWRDAWQIVGAIGRYIISGRPMTQEEWICERAVMIDVTPKKPDAHFGGAIMPMPGVVQVHHEQLCEELEQVRIALHH
jgi:hypothetical protein